MAQAVYILGFLVTLTCSVLLFRAYAGVKNRLLLWSAICFAGLALSNLLLFLDLVVFTNLDLYPLRLVTAAVSMMILLFGLIWEGGR